MIHDGEGNPCRKTEGNIMSPTLAGNNGVFFWSTCSRQYLSRFLGLVSASKSSTRLLLELPRLKCWCRCWRCVHQDNPGILSGGWAEANRPVQVPRKASWAVVWRRHSVQVAVWLQGQVVRPWFCQGETSFITIATVLLRINLKSPTALHLWALTPTCQSCSFLVSSTKEVLFNWGFIHQHDFFTKSLEPPAPDPSLKCILSFQWEYPACPQSLVVVAYRPLCLAHSWALIHM